MLMQQVSHTIGIDANIGLHGPSPGNTHQGTRTETQRNAYCKRQALGKSTSGQLVHLAPFRLQRHSSHLAYPVAHHNTCLHLESTTVRRV